MSPRMLIAMGLAVTAAAWSLLGAALAGAADLLTASGPAAVLLPWALGWTVGPLLVLYGGQALDAELIRGPRHRTEAPGFFPGAVGAGILIVLVGLSAGAVATSTPCTQTSFPCNGQNCTVPAEIAHGCVSWLSMIVTGASVVGFFGVVLVEASGGSALWAARATSGPP